MRTPIRTAHLRTRIRTSRISIIAMNIRRGTGFHDHRHEAAARESVPLSAP